MSAKGIRGSGEVMFNDLNIATLPARTTENIEALFTQGNLVLSEMIFE